VTGPGAQEEAEAKGETEEALMAAWSAFEEANPLDEEGVPLRDHGLLGLLLTNKPNPEAGRPHGCEQVSPPPLPPSPLPPPHGGAVTRGQRTCN
jgi:hypothetical protein